jgi:hypothetical protein
MYIWVVPTKKGSTELFFHPHRYIATCSSPLDPPIVRASYWLCCIWNILPSFFNTGKRTFTNGTCTSDLPTGEMDAVVVVTDFLATLQPYNLQLTNV